MKILYLTYSAAPYRVALLNEIAKECEVSAVYEKSSAHIKNRDPGWFREEEENYRHVCIDGGRLIPLLADESFDAAVVCGYLGRYSLCALLYLKHRGVPVLVCADGMLRKEHDPLRLIRKTVLSLADGFLLSGRVTEMNMRPFLPDGRPVFYFPLTTLRRKEIRPVSEEEKEYLRKKHGISGKTVILGAGQFIERKGYDLLLRALPHGEDVHLYLAGDSPPAEWQTDDPRVHFPGFLDHRTLMEFMRAADIFAHPAREEVWGIAVTEAMAMSCCVITTDRCTAGLELICSGRNGILIRAGSREELNAALQEACGDEWYRKKLGEEAYRTVMNMTVERSAAAHLHALKAVSRK